MLFHSAAMVVRELVGRAIFSVPVVGRVARYTTGASSSDAKLEVEVVLDDDQIEVVEPDSPREKIHRQLLKNRIDRAEAFIDDDEATLTDPEVRGIDGVREHRVEEYLHRQASREMSQPLPQEPLNSPGFVSYLVTLGAQRLLGRRRSPSVDPFGEGEAPKVLVAKRLLDTDIKMDLFLDSLDNTTKKRLLQELAHDLEIHGESPSPTPRVANSPKPGFNQQPSPDIGVDKLKEALIILIKFGVVCWKILMPLFRYFYRRYMDNTLYLINQRNTATVFDFVLKVMRIAEQRLGENEDMIDHIYNKGRRLRDFSDRQVEALYSEISLEALHFFNLLLIRQLLFEFVLGRVYVPKPSPRPRLADMPKLSFEENLYKFETMNR